MPNNIWFYHFSSYTNSTTSSSKRTPKFASKHTLLHSPHVYLSSTWRCQEQTSGAKSPLSRLDTILRRSTASVFSGHVIATCYLNVKEHLPPGNSLCHCSPRSTAFSTKTNPEFQLQGAGAFKAFSLPQSP